MSKHEETDDFDEGTHVLEHLADEIAAERERGASALEVPSDDPDYVEDPDTIERSESDDRSDEGDGPVVPPVRPA